LPIFMDRHDARGTTQQEAAELHRQDLAIQGRYGVKFLTYWFDDQRGTVFCLLDAPDAESAARAHRESHGQIAGEIIEVDLSAVEAFLGRMQDPKPGAAGVQVDAGFRAVMFTDIVGSTEMTARLGDLMAVEAIRAHDSLVRKALARFGGREVKHTGDGIMASFERASAGVECAQAIQRAFADYNASSREPLRVRIGLHAGEPVADSNDLFGATVQLASRLCDAAQPGQILVSDAIPETCEDQGSFIEVGSQRLKGFAEPVRSFEVAWRRAAP
jgi:class 3 adenylate cyclase